MRLADTHDAYDLVIAGGGVTGAGVFSLAVAMGYRPLLVEKNDFAWGTSSRSSKMVHGGLRYLKQGRFLLTRGAVRERERLLCTYPGLVTPLEFFLPVYRSRGPSRPVMAAGLNIYSFLAGQKQHQTFNRADALARVPELTPEGLVSAFGFKDAQVDDARLVLRLIFDAVDRGGHALNYTAATGLLRDRKGRVAGISLEDWDSGRTKEIRTRAVINATGPFAETLHPSPVKGLHIRPLRGSHLIFPGSLMPLDRVVSFLHPRDRRPVFLFPWQGALVLGTTDVDHGGPLATEPGISRQEANYLLEGVETLFPGKGFSDDAAVAAISGIRPVLSRGKKSASGESREHMIWKDRGLVTVTGGKLTTFGLLARDAIRAAATWLPREPAERQVSQFVEPWPIEKPTVEKDHAETPLVTVGRMDDVGISEEASQRLAGRLGERLPRLAPLMTSENRQCIPGTETLWAELAHGAAGEMVRHLPDLLLRRVRIGLLLPGGGFGMMDEIRRRLSPFLDWDEKRWADEIADYKKIWEQAHSPRPGSR